MRWYYEGQSELAHAFQDVLVDLLNGDFLGAAAALDGAERAEGIG